MKRRPPDQGSLDEALGSASRLRVTEVIGGGRLLDVRDRQEIAAFAATLRIAPTEPFHCLCPGDQHLRFSRPWRRDVTVTLHHGRSIRWDAEWDSDALLAEPDRVNGWLAERGVTGPETEYRRMQEETGRSHVAWEAWRAAALPCLAPVLDELSGLGTVPPDVEDPPTFARTRRLLSDAYATEEEVVLALLTWFARGEGGWSAFPSYEGVAERLLLGFPTETVVRALTAVEPTPAQLEGAARLIASWWFGKLRPGEAGRLPVELAQRLLEAVEASGRPEHVGALRRALDAR